MGLVGLRDAAVAPAEEKQRVVFADDLTFQRPAENDGVVAGREPLIHLTLHGSDRTVE
jgi:hypothetical protein